jgi:hypothetical protein
MIGQHDKDAAHTLGGVPCRAEEFGRWSRVMLMHEREHLSKTMATQRAFLKQADVEAIMHDLTDIDQILAHMGTDELKFPELAMATDAEVKDLLGIEPISDLPFEMWPASEGKVPPSKRRDPQ